MVRLIPEEYDSLHVKSFVLRNWLGAHWLDSLGPPPSTVSFPSSSRSYDQSVHQPVSQQDPLTHPQFSPHPCCC